MTKAELISAVAESVDLKKKDVERVVNSVFSTIEAALAQGEKVQLMGFGTFLVRRRPARLGRNPQTGEEINIAETTVPVFKPGKSLKDAVS